jgi:hypothetical protein
LEKARLDARRIAKKCKALRKTAFKNLCSIAENPALEMDGNAGKHNVAKLHNLWFRFQKKKDRAFKNA